MDPEARTTHAGQTSDPLAFSSSAPFLNPSQEKVLALNGTTLNESGFSSGSTEAPAEERARGFLISSNFALSVELEVADQSTSSEI